MSHSTRDTESAPKAPRKARRRKTRGLVDLLRNTMGSVTTEAVVMLPAFIIIWGCIIYVAKKYERAVEVQAVARNCAWRHAKDNCEGDVRCGMSSVSATDLSAPQAGEIQSGQSAVGFLGSFISDILVGPDTRSSYEGSAARPEVIGGGRAQLRGGMRMACNEKPRGSLQEIVNSAWSNFWGG